MVKNSPDFRWVPSPSVAVPDVEALRSDLFGNSVQLQPDMTGVSASPGQKRRRGRPPKPKSPVQPSDIQNGPVEETQQTSRPRGRPRKHGARSTAQAAPVAAVMKRRGRPPGRRGPGRLWKPKSVSAPATVSPFAANVARRRGRPKRVEMGVAAVPTAQGGEVMAVVPVAEEGEVAVATPAKRRGRPPKIGGAVSKPMRPVPRIRRPVGRPRKETTVVSRQEAVNYGELKRKYELLQVKVKEAVKTLKGAVLVIQELEEVAAVDTERATAYGRSSGGRAINQ